jgi:hypothetical protein
LPDKLVYQQRLILMNVVEHEQPGWTVGLREISHEPLQKETPIARRVAKEHLDNAIVTLVKGK